MLLLPLLAPAGPPPPPPDTADTPAETAVTPGMAGPATGLVPPDGRPPGLVSTGAPRPIRTNTPGTGVFIGSGLVVQTRFDREGNGTESLESWTVVADFRHTPATHWVIGGRLPFVVDRRLERAAGATAGGVISRSGLGDASLAVKHRFFRAVGRWSDRHAAVEIEAKLPTGSADLPATDDLPLRHRLAPGTGSVDFIADLIYQEGRRRFIYGGDLSFRLNTEGEDGYRFGNEVRLNLDLEYILLPLQYRRPGNEVFVLLETTIRRKWADEADGRSLERTERTDLLLAPAVQHIVSDQLLVSLSVQVPAISDAPAGGLEQELDVLAELRYAF